MMSPIHEKGLDLYQLVEGSILSPLKTQRPEALSTLPLFRAMRPQTQARLWTEGRLTAHQKGYVLFTQGDIADWFFAVQSGWVKVVRETVDGEEMVLDLVSGGRVFGETAYFLGQRFPFGAEVVDETALWMFPQSILTQEIKGHPPFAMALMTHMAKDQTRRDKDLEHHTLQTAAQRLGCFLLRLCGDEAQGSISVDLPLDKHLIASYLGMKPETFSRTLARLADDVGLHVDGARIDIPRHHDLVRYVCQACSNVFPCEGDHQT